MNLENSDFHEIIAINCYGKIITDPRIIEILAAYNVPYGTIKRGVAKIMAIADVGPNWVKLAEMPALNLELKNDKI